MFGRNGSMFFIGMAFLASVVFYLTDNDLTILGVFIAVPLTMAFQNVSGIKTESAIRPKDGKPALTHPVSKLGNFRI